VAETLFGISEVAGVAYGGKDGPAALSVFKLAEPTGLVAVPTVDIASVLAGHSTAAEASADFIEGVHYPCIFQ